MKLRRQLICSAFILSRVRVKYRGWLMRQFALSFVSIFILFLSFSFGNRGMVGDFVLIRTSVGLNKVAAHPQVSDTAIQVSISLCGASLVRLESCLDNLSKLRRIRKVAFDSLQIIHDEMRSVSQRFLYFNVVGDTVIYVNGRDRVQDSLKNINERDSILQVLVRRKMRSANALRVSDSMLCILVVDSVDAITAYQRVKSLVYRGIRNYTGSLRFDFKGRNYLAYVANRDSVSVEMFWSDKKSGKQYGNFAELNLALLSNGRKPEMITNGGMFVQGYKPQGLFIDRFEVKTPLDTGRDNPNLNFSMKPNGVFFRDSAGWYGVLETEDFIATHGYFKKGSKSKKLMFATQSGPMLVVKGAIHPRFTMNSKNLNIRNGVGLPDNRVAIFVISEDPVNFFDFAKLYKDVLGCDNALYLDGAISDMYVEGMVLGRGGNFGVMIAALSKRTAQ